MSDFQIYSQSCAEDAEHMSLLASRRGHVESVSYWDLVAANHRDDAKTKTS